MPHLATYVGLVDHSEMTLADSFRTVADAQAAHPDIYFMCQTLAKMSDQHRGRSGPWCSATASSQAARPASRSVCKPPGSVRHARAPVGLLRDLQDLHVLADLVQTSWTVVHQGAQGLRDEELGEIATHAQQDTARQLAWLVTRMKAAAPQALLVAR